MACGLDFNDTALRLVTTARSREYLRNRFFDNPYIDYRFCGYVKDGLLSAYVVSRNEVLAPLGYGVNRIIDMYGNADSIPALLREVIRTSAMKRHCYVDFSMFGDHYRDPLLSAGFMPLRDEECSILPQVTSPIANRPNNEYLGILNRNPGLRIDGLTKRDVYFSRMDSDRDRLANIRQLQWM